MKKHVLKALLAIVGVSVLIGLAACTGGSTGTPIVMQGTMTKGSAIVGGVRFEDNAASITADDTAKTNTFLETGMTVKVKGTLNDDKMSGEAELIQVENEVRGAIDSITASTPKDNFVALGQVVYVDGGTVFDNTTGLAGGNPLLVGDDVEVHGQRDQLNRIRVARVEKLTVSPGDEVRGR